MTGNYALYKDKKKIKMRSDVMERLAILCYTYSSRYAE